MRSVAIALACLAACACAGSKAARGARVRVVAEENRHNVLAMRLRVEAPGATTAHAVWVEDGAVRRSPPVPVSRSGQALVHLLGLRPSTAYEAVVEAAGPGGARRSTPVTFTTGSLPAPVAALALRVAGAPPEGYVLVNLLSTAPGVLAAFDGRGTLRWYRVFEGADPVAEAKQLAGGNFLAFVGATPGWTLVDGAYLELAPSGEILRSLRATPPLYTDNHEVLVTGAGTPAERIHLFGYESRIVDLAPLGLPGRGPIVGHTLQRLRRDGTAEFTWNAFDHIALDELVNPSQPGQIVGFDYDHPNSLHIDPRGDYLVSFRNLDAVVLVDSGTGEIRWRLGGKRSDFTFLDDPLGGFSGQHDARFLPDGRLLLFDNGTLHDPPTSRAVEYELDLDRRTARKVWEHRVGRFNEYTGSAVRDPDGATWVGVSMFGVVQRVARDGAILWEGRLERAGKPAPFYRAVPFRSLYGAARGDGAGTACAPAEGKALRAEPSSAARKAATAAARTMATRPRKAAGSMRVKTGTNAKAGTRLATRAREARPARRIGPTAPSADRSAA